MWARPPTEQCALSRRGALRPLTVTALPLPGLLRAPYFWLRDLPTATRAKYPRARVLIICPCCRESAPLCFSRSRGQHSKPFALPTRRHGRQIANSMNPRLPDTVRGNSANNDGRVVHVHAKQLSRHDLVQELELYRTTKRSATVQVRQNVYFIQFSDQAIAETFKVCPPVMITEASLNDVDKYAGPTRAPRQ